MTEAPARTAVALVGMRCSGKSTVGRRLATALERAFVDLDDEVLLTARYAGLKVKTVGEAIAQAGLARFRELEAWALRRVLEPSPRVVLATGGGVVERSDNRAWLVRTARCVFLSVPVERLVARMASDPTRRPPLLGGTDPAEELARLLAQREEHYRSVAEVVIECDEESPEELVRRIRAALGECN